MRIVLLISLALYVALASAWCPGGALYASNGCICPENYFSVCVYCLRLHWVYSIKKLTYTQRVGTSDQGEPECRCIPCGDGCYQHCSG